MKRHHRGEEMGSNLGKHFSIMLVVIILAELIVLRMVAPPVVVQDKNRFSSIH
jgi:hypothetical protein